MRRCSDAEAGTAGWRWRPQPMQVLFRLQEEKKGRGDERGNLDRMRGEGRGETYPKLCAEQLGSAQLCGEEVNDVWVAVSVAEVLTSSRRRGSSSWGWAGCWRG